VDSTGDASSKSGRFKYNALTVGFRPNIGNGDRQQSVDSVEKVDSAK
jgi:hypothetical protein